MEKLKPVIVNGENVDPVTKNDIAGLIRDFKKDNEGKRIKIAGPVIERALESADYEDFKIKLSETFNQIKAEIKVRGE